MKERKALGRGISSLIPKKSKVERIQKEIKSENTGRANLTPTEPKNDLGLRTLLMSDVHPNMSQPRKHFDVQALEELKSSIEVSGVLQPILVRRSDKGGYEIIAGERRYRASKLAGKKEIPAIVKNYDAQTQLEVSIVENLQREDLSPIEEAKGYQRLEREFFLNKEMIAKKVGKDRSTISNLMRLLQLSPIVQGFVNESKLSMGHARALLAFDKAIDQERMAQKVIADGMSVRAIELYIKQLNKPQESKKNGSKNSVLSADLKNVQNELQRALGTKVELKTLKKGGEIKIHYYNDADLNRIYKIVQA